MGEKRRQNIPNEAVYLFLKIFLNYKNILNKSENIKAYVNVIELFIF